MKVGLIIHHDDVVNVFFHDETGKLKRKVWLRPDGSVTFRDFDKNERGEKTLIPKVKEGKPPNKRKVNK